VRSVRLALAACLLTACSASSAAPGDTSRDGGGADTDPGASTDTGTVTSTSDTGSANGGDSAEGEEPTRMLSAPEQGIATYYAADGTGNCSFDATPNDLMVAAMDAPEYDNSAVCGECVQLTGPNATITVRIVDQCPGCEMGHLDLSQQAFAMIADVSLGRVPITWNVVTCDVTGPIAYRFKEGSSQYWTAIQVRNARLPIAKLEWMSGGSWVAVARQSYNYFVIASGVGTTGPFQVRVTASDGQELVDTLPAVVAATVVNGAGQFH